MLTVAQLVRAPDCGSGGRRFDSGRSAHFSLGRRQVGKARDFDSRIRRFESCRPSQCCNKPRYGVCCSVGPLAQGQSIRLLSGESLVRIQHGPPNSETARARECPGCFCLFSAIALAQSVQLLPAFRRRPQPSPAVGYSLLGYADCLLLVSGRRRRDATRTPPPVRVRQG